MRKKKHAEHVNHERWLVSYADFITLLFAFFVVMFAVSQVDTKKLGHFTEAFSKAVGINVMPMTGASLLGGASASDEKEMQPSDAKTGELDELASAFGTLTMFPGDASLRGLQIIRRGNELVLRLPENVFFDTGDARPKAHAVAALKLIAPQVVRRPVEVRVEGYTDDRPIVSGRYRSNWELSAARALGVMAVLVTEHVPPERVSIAGYGEFRPIVANTSEEGRKQNRRVDLVLSLLRPTGPERPTAVALADIPVREPVPDGVSARDPSGAAAPGPDSDASDRKEDPDAAGPASPGSTAAEGVAADPGSAGPGTAEAKSNVTPAGSVE